MGGRVGTVLMAVTVGQIQITMERGEGDLSGSGVRPTQTIASKAIAQVFQGYLTTVIWSRFSEATERVVGNQLDHTDSAGATTLEAQHFLLPELTISSLFLDFSMHTHLPINTHPTPRFKRTRRHLNVTPWIIEP